MPVYEYICKECGKEFEVKQSIKESQIEVCPECNGKVQRKISGGSGFIMKGNHSGPAQPRCGKEQTCCGSATPCATPSCGSK